VTFSPKATPAQRLKAVERLIAELKADTRPILLGPWRSELGFESLYWLPFLRKLAAQVPGFDKRAAVVTRGGLAPLYAPIASQGYDLYALRSVTEVRRENLYDHQTTGLQKQLTPTAWDDAVLADAADALGLGTVYHTIHPAWMYWACEPFWNEDAGLKHLLTLADFTPIDKPVIQGTLPPRYVAVKFYHRATFPYPDAQVSAFVQQTVANLAAQTDVVLLSSAGDYDDHGDIACSGNRIHALPANLPPEQNLLWQAAVLAHATAFVGTYGGVAQLALRMGVPSVSFYQAWHATAHGHLSLSSWLSKQTRVPFLAGSIDDSHLWSQVVGGVVVQREKEQVAA